MCNGQQLWSNLFFLLYFAGLVKSPHSLKEINIYGDHVPQQKTANHSEIAYSIENCYIHTTLKQCEKTPNIFL